MDFMGRIRTAYLLCTRITLETILYESYESEAREGPVFFHRSGCVFSSVAEVPGGFFKLMKNHEFSPCMGQKKSSMSQTL